jgi:hypothetical protein
MLMLILASIACNLPGGETDAPVIEPTQAEPTEAVAPGGVFADLDQFKAEVERAVLAGDFEAMAQLMGTNGHNIGVWGSEGYQTTRIEAAAEISANVPPGASFVPGINLSDVAGGTNPLTIWDPAVNVVDGLLLGTYGQDSAGQAVLVIARADNGDHYWYATLIAPCGFEGSCAPDGNTGFREQFEADLMNAIASADFEAMKSFMLPGENFEIGGWRSGGSVHTPDSAVQVFIDSGWMAGPVQFDPSRDVAAILGQNPADFFGGGINFIFGYGFGADGASEAIIVIDSTDDGQLHWRSILFAQGGF